MSTPLSTQPQVTGNERSGADPVAIAGTADILRQVAAADRNVDARRADVSGSLAELVAALGRSHRDVPPEITARVMSVVAAVDRATGNRRRR